MKIRELLQKEIWSKRTSRKILIGFGIIVTGFIVLCEVDRYWITPPERDAGRVALSQVDALQDFREMNDAEYDAQYRQAKGKVDTATEKALTSRDDLIAALLGFYLQEIDFERTDQKRQIYRFDPEAERRDKKSLQYVKMVQDSLRRGLHKSLDK